MIINDGRNLSDDGSGQHQVIVVDPDDGHRRISVGPLQRPMDLPQCVHRPQREFFVHRFISLQSTDTEIQQKLINHGQASLIWGFPILPILSSYGGEKKLNMV